jgi:hypothetical protein
MGATFAFSESNGAGQVVHDGIANINFGSNDSYDLVPATYPITRGTNSFCKYIRGKFTGSWTEISNMKFWKSNGEYKTDESISAGFNVTYATPTQDDQRVTGIGDTAVPTSEPSQNVNSFEGASTIVYGATGVSGYTGYIRLQTQTLVTTPSGVVNQKQFTLQFDET